MERLTKKNDSGGHYYPKCFEKCNGLGESSKCDNCEIMTSVCEKLGDYEDLEEQGRLIKLVPIKGFEDYYAVDMFGCVYGISAENKNGRRIVKRKPYISKNGYVYITLEANGNIKNARVHRLVAEAFIPNPNNYRAVNHIDGDKTNNCVWNLEWCTDKYNSIHAYKNGLLTPPTNLKDGVYVNGKNKYALIMNTSTGEMKIFDSFGKATRYIGRGKNYIWDNLKRGKSRFHSREFKIQVFLTKSEAESKLTEWLQSEAE